MSSIPALVVAALVVAAAMASATGCYWDSRPVANDASSTSTAGDGQANPSETVSGRDKGGNPSPPPNRNPGIPAGTPSFKFGNIDYVLANRSDVVNQYVPFGQTLDNWTSMFALRKFPGMPGPDNAVNNVTQTLQAEHPDTKFKVTPDQATGDRGVDFLIWTPDKMLTEFDVHIYQRRDGGVLGKMFMMRGYGPDGHMDLLKKVADDKAALTRAVFGFDFPVFITPN